MDLSDEWLGRSAGWKAWQEARKIFADGRVLEVEREGEFFTGKVMIAGKAQRVRVKIIGASEIETHCICRANRLDGAFCCHAAALLLGYKNEPNKSLQDNKPAELAIKKASAAKTQSRKYQPRGATLSAEASTQNKAGQASAFAVKIRSQSLLAMRQGRPLTLEISGAGSNSDVVADEYDTELADWMHSMGLSTRRSDEGDDIPSGLHQLLQVKSSELESLLSSLRGHQRVWVDDEICKMPVEPCQPRLKINIKGERCRLSLCEAFDDWHSFDDSWWRIRSNSMQIGPSRSELVDQLMWNELLELPLAEFLASLAELQDQFHFQPPLDTLVTFHTVIPQIIIHFEGSGGYLEVEPKAKYPGLPQCLSILEPNGQAQWLPQKNRANSRHSGCQAAGLKVCYQRARSIETQVIQFFIDHGFAPDQGEPTMRLRGEEQVLDFLAGTFTQLRSLGWEIQTSTTLTKILSKVEFIRPAIKIRSGTPQKGNDTEDWHHLEISYQGSSARTFAKADIIHALRGGRRKFKLPNGKLAIIDSQAVEDLEELLHDANPQHLSKGCYRVKSAHIESFLNCVKINKKTFVINEKPSEIERKLEGFEALLQDEIFAGWQNHDLAFGTGGLEALIEDAKWAESKLAATLRDYQRVGVIWLARQCQLFGGGILADDMGLGKTLQSIALSLIMLRRKAPNLIDDKTDQKLESRGRGAGRGAELHSSENPAERQPVLVVAPTSLLSNWQEEFARFAPQLRLLIWHGSQREQLREQWSHKQNDYDVVVSSFGVLSRDRVFFNAQEWALVLVDEASQIRNPATQNAKACFALNAKARVAITGTPIENSVRDLWSAFRFALPGYLGSLQEFQQRYEDPISQNPSDAEALRRLRLRTLPHLLRRTKDQVAKDLPAKQESIVWCPLSPVQTEIYHKIVDHSQTLIAESRRQGSEQAARMQTLTALLRLRQCCCDPALTGLEIPSDLSLEAQSGKLFRLISIIREMRKNNQKALIFSNFTKLLNCVEKLLVPLGIPWLRLDGQSRRRGELVEQFQQPDGPPIFLISLKAGGYGLNLTAAEVVIHLDPWWNPAAEAQATDRAHRIGQTKPVNVYKLVTQGTVEEKIIRMQTRKKLVASSAIQDQASDSSQAKDAEPIKPNQLSTEELIKLFGQLTP